MHVDLRQGPLVADCCTHRVSAPVQKAKTRHQARETCTAHRVPAELRARSECRLHGRCTCAGQFRQQSLSRAQGTTNQGHTVSCWAWHQPPQITLTIVGNIARVGRAAQLVLVAKLTTIGDACSQHRMATGGSAGAVCRLRTVQSALAAPGLAAGVMHAQLPPDAAAVCGLLWVNV